MGLVFCCSLGAQNQAGAQKAGSIAGWLAGWLGQFLQALREVLAVLGTALMLSV